MLDIRNGLSHMKIKDNMNISDKQLDVYFNDIEECVDAVKAHQQTLKADDIKDCLKQVIALRGYCTPDHFFDCLCIFSKTTTHW